MKHFERMLVIFVVILSAGVLIVGTQAIRDLNDGRVYSALK
jgi:hypothetical protein